MMGATFKKVPSFNQADFKQAPDLDNVDFPLPGYWRRGDHKLIPLYRAIRRMAIQSADYEREQMAFKGETRSKRGTEHKPWHTAFWFGIAYDAFSDFGRSIARPLGDLARLGRRVCRDLCLERGRGRVRVGLGLRR